MRGIKVLGRRRINAYNDSSNIFAIDFSFKDIINATSIDLSGLYWAMYGVIFIHAYEDAIAHEIYQFLDKDGDIDDVRFGKPGFIPSMAKYVCSDWCQISGYNSYSQSLRFDPDNADTRGCINFEWMEDNGEAHYYHYDGLGSTRFLTDGDGVESDAYRYTAYGEVEGASGNTVNNYRFAGEQFDPELEMYYLRARYYDPAVGRFGSMDPFRGVLTKPVSLHRYLYAKGDRKK